MKIIVLYNIVLSMQINRDLRILCIWDHFKESFGYRYLFLVDFFPHGFIRYGCSKFLEILFSPVTHYAKQLKSDFFPSLIW